MTVQHATMPRQSRPPLFERINWRWFVRDWTVTLGVIGIYFLIRGLAPANPDIALQVTAVLIDIEKATYTFWEPQIQEASIRVYEVKEFANFVYAYMHFPVLGAVGLWLWFRDRERFTFVRNVMFFSMVFGILFYYLVPAAPPRLLEVHGQDLGFVDTVFGGGTNVSYAQPAWILNEYAAIPSFHFGWIALASAGIWVNTRNIVARSLAIALSVVMTWAIIASANHFWIDMAAGGAIIVLCWWLARRLERRNAERQLAAAARANLIAAPPEA